MNIFDYIKVYDQNWKEINSRKFSQEEIERIDRAVVIMGEYGKAVRFISNKGNQYISLEPSSATEVNIDDLLDMRDMTLVELKYVGSDEKVKTQKCLKIRLSHQEDKEMSFDNPFDI